MKVYLHVHCQWWLIANMHANVLPCPFNFTVLPHIKLFLPINTIVVCQENVTNARTLLYTAVHGLPF